MHEHSPTTAAVDVTRFPTTDDDSSRTGTHACGDLEILSLSTTPSPSTLPSTLSSSSSLPKPCRDPDPGECTKIEDYYKKYDATRAKRLIDALPLPMHEICSECAKLEESPVYSDRFFYKGKPLLAREMTLSNSPNLDGDVLDFMPVHTIVKPNAAGIFYSIGSFPDGADLKTSLEPSIFLLETSTSTPEAPKTTKNKSRAHLHLPLAERGYSRVSEKLGIVEPMRLPLLTSAPLPKFEQNNSCKLSIDEEPEPGLAENRSSLLMLEPLLLMPSRTAAITATNRRRQLASKKQLADSEHLKLVRIVIAYTLTFLLLVSITFYVVYFR